MPGTLAAKTIRSTVFSPDRPNLSGASAWGGGFLSQFEAAEDSHPVAAHRPFEAGLTSPPAELELNSGSKRQIKTLKRNAHESSKCCSASV